MKRLAAATLTLALSIIGRAQTQPPATPALTDPYAITFDDIRRADNERWYSIVQLRFIRTIDPTSNQARWMGLAERLSAAPPAAGTTEPRFDLEFATPLGIDSEIESRQAGVFQDHRAFLHHHGSFRVQDPALAATNYTIHFEGATFRLGRAVFRVSIIPNRPEQNIWVLDLDTETGFPLTRSEYSPAGTMVSMLTIVQFAHGTPAQNAIGNTPSWWTRSNTQSYATMSAAIGSIATQSTLIEPRQPPSGFTLVDSRVVTESLTGARTLVFDYSDGVDSLHLLQIPLSPDAAKMQLLRNRGEYAILQFEDLQTKQMMFELRGTQFIVIGTPNDPAVENFAHEMLRSALNQK